MLNVPSRPLARLSVGRALALVAALILSAQAPIAAAAPAATSAASTKKKKPSILTSKDLWATVDVCSPKDQPDTFGVRASIPGDGKSSEKMYMRFRVQFLNQQTGVWSDVVGADSNFVSVGSARFKSRQAGRNFQFALPKVPGNQPYALPPTFTLRGSVSFQWRKGKKIVRTTSKITTGGHRSVAGSDPRGFSAATCFIT
jgi:hypothetical protein